MASLNVNMTGFAQLQARLEKLSKQEATKAGQAANRAGAGVVRKAIAREAPSGPTAQGAQITRHNKDGSTRIETHHKIKKSVKVNRTKSNSPTQVQNTVTTGKAYHARFVEYGSIHNAPDPFFQRAISADQQATIDAMSASLEKQLIKRGV